MHIFYTPKLENDVYTLSAEESKHAARVLRIQLGDHVKLIDGQGGLYTAEVLDNHPKRCEVRVIDKLEQYGKRNYHLHIAIAPTKNIDRFEWFLEKATEFGVDEITPILCARSERKIIKPERLEKIITAATKQSVKAYHPKLNPLCPLKTFMHSRLNGQKFVAHLVDDKRKLLSQLAKPQGYNTVLIGPEGDFSPSEVEALFEQEFQPVSLGNSRLRTETAGVAVAHTFALLDELQTE